MPTADWVMDRGLELLTAAENALTQARTGLVPPDRTGLTHGEPVVEKCTGTGGSGTNGQLYVYAANPVIDVQSVSVGQAMQRGPRQWMPYVRFLVDYWRCVPPREGHATPSAAKLSTYAQQMLQVGWALITGLEQSRLAGTLFPGITGGPFVPKFGNLLPLNPRGGLGGWRIMLEVPINDPGP